MVVEDCFRVLLLEKGDLDPNELINEELDFFLAGVENVEGSGRLG